MSDLVCAQVPSAASTTAAALNTSGIALAPMTFRTCMLLVIGCTRTASASKFMIYVTSLLPIVFSSEFTFFFRVRFRCTSRRRFPERGASASSVCATGSGSCRCRCASCSTSASVPTAAAVGGVRSRALTRRAHAGRARARLAPGDVRPALRMARAPLQRVRPADRRRRESAGRRRHGGLRAPRAPERPTRRLHDALLRRHEGTSHTSLSTSCTGAYSLHAFVFMPLVGRHTVQYSVILITISTFVLLLRVTEHTSV